FRYGNGRNPQKQPHLKNKIMFLKKEDLYAKIRKNELEQITGNDDTLVLHAMQAAVSEMEPYLKERYNTKDIFTKQDRERNPLLVSFAVDIAIFEIISIALPGQDLQDRRERYKRAIDYLKQVRDEKLNLELPKKENTLQGGGDTAAHGSNPKRNNYF
ncbi:MAG: phage protein Gp36 family protein, partial [Bacteroidales bacterium]